MKGKRLLVVFAGAVFGLTGVLLVRLGNPPNMGICIACFLRDIAGSLGLHRTAIVQYMRPEIPGLVLGAFTAALAAREFRAVGGSATFTRFILGMTAMLGMLVFLGCPLRALLRLAGGDLNALLGLAGLFAGVSAGAFFISRGFTLGRAAPQKNFHGYVFPALFLVFLSLLALRPPLLFFSKEGPGSLHAPFFISLGAGILLGILAQRSRLCTIGGIRDFLLFRDPHLLYGFLALFGTALLANLALGSFKPGFTDQPVAHSDGLWNFLGMALAGWCSALLGGCPLRQLVAAGEGNTDCAATVLGLLFGAALAHNLGFAASAKGVPPSAQAAVIFGFLVVLLISVLNSSLFTIFAKKKGDLDVQGN
ncbi:MAG: YedE family putative selenium transporter [Desulfotomaculales bacterium]